jgi:hypothetical protein
MTRLIYCLPYVLGDAAVRARPGVARFAHLFRLYGNWVVPLDRTGTISTPIRSVSLFPVPTYRAFSKSYEDLCSDRAGEILGKAEKLGVRIYVMYSGGIDSTCILVSLLKQATPQQRKNIVVLLSQESIAEYPRFYQEHIRGKLKVDSSIRFPDLLGGGDMLLSAEHNDMVMGSDKIGDLMTRYGPDVIHERYSRDLITDLLETSLNGDAEAADFYVDLFERIRDVAPVPIDTNFEFLWWINFAVKWQACYAYIVMLTPPKNAHGFTKNYLDTRFVSFFNTEDFQLWSMNNPDKRIRDTWTSYKWIAKQVIYDYTKDAEYRDNKVKNGSLIWLTNRLYTNSFLDEDLRFSNDLAPETYLEPRNDFA